MSSQTQLETVLFLSNDGDSRPPHFFPKRFFENCRLLTDSEKETLLKNGNRFLNGAENSFFVDSRDGAFDAGRIRDCEFLGTVIVGRLTEGRLHFHDLDLETGIFASRIENCRIGDHCVVRNVRYLSNYDIGSQTILFNIEEMSCTPHAKFGNGIVKEGEEESVRIWIDVRNENGGRRVLPFEGMLTADAWLWSQFRGDVRLQERLFEMTTAAHSRRQNEFGTIGEKCVIKNTRLIKDVKVTDGAYIKGALKLKNITVLSSFEEPSQIGEGVEMVNGIMGYGSRVFYQATAVRFVLGRNCCLKYGARLLHSVLGANSTVSCCEILNNLIFPFHEQHHNTSFLIAAEVMGQSNLAAGATAGSNHNSRSPDGELIAGRGFWPGLSSSFTHNSRFASFCLATRGSYRHPLDIRYPFALISVEEDNKLSVFPAFWFESNMYAVARNKSKFTARDKRRVKALFLEVDPIAPDTVAEMLEAMDRLERLTAEQQSDGEEPTMLLLDPQREPFELFDRGAQKRYGARIVNPGRAYRAYRRQVILFAARTLSESEAAAGPGEEDLLRPGAWENAGGQLMTASDVEQLKTAVKEGRFSRWEEVHRFYGECAARYTEQKCRMSEQLIVRFYGKPLSQMTAAEREAVKTEALEAAESVYRAAADSRRKDFSDVFRRSVYRTKEEAAAVLGKFEDDVFLRQLKSETRELCRKINERFSHQ